MALVPNTPLLKQSDVVGNLPADILAELEAVFARLPALESIIASLVARVGVRNINWVALLKVIAGSILGGPLAVIVAVLANLNLILPDLASHALPVAQQLVAQAAFHQ